MLSKLVKLREIVAKSRRAFLIDVARGASVTSITALGLVSYSKGSYAKSATAIRPPGALVEDDFVSACIRCGLCVNDCPYPTLSLAQELDNLAIGTPFFTARQAACEMCDDIPCVAACPTGALDKNLTEINQSKMGLARIVDKYSCIAFQGLRCEVCFNVCPARGEAIVIETRHNQRSKKHALFIPVVNYDHCTGCGKCEEACILEEAAIKVLPLRLATGKMQDHYRLGWQEKAKQGESLVAPDSPHQYNLPKGQNYDHAGEGLIKETPFSDNPLNTLNNNSNL